MTDAVATKWNAITDALTGSGRAAGRHLPPGHIAVVGGDSRRTGRVATLLSERGHAVTRYEDLEVGLGLIDAPPEVLVLVGDALPDGSGLELVARLRQLESPERLAVLVLTAAEEEALLRAYAAGADDVVSIDAAAPLLIAKTTHLLRRLRLSAPAPYRDALLPAGALALGRYRVREVLGRGGFGAVYGARDEVSGREVALKVARSQGDPSHVQRFLREGYCLAAVRDPHVVRVEGLSARDGLLFCAMERIEGPTLFDRTLERGPCGAAGALALLRGLGAALAALGARDLVHRDVKPLNVLLRGGRIDRPVLVDFGLAKRPFDSGLTSPDIMLGSPGYMAPEVLHAQPDARADLFALGQVVRFALTGRDPFPDLDRLARVEAMAHRQVPLPRGLPKPLHATLDRLTRVDPRERYPSAQALLRDLDCAARAA